MKSIKIVSVAAALFLVASGLKATTISLSTTAISGNSYITCSDTTFSISGALYTGSYEIADWALFGAGASQTQVEKASTDYIGTITGATSKTASGSFYQSWTGGTPVASGTDSRGETYQGTGSSSGGGTSMVFTANMPSSQGHIYLVMSNYYTEADIVVNVNGSLSTFANVFGSKSGSVSRLFDISISDVDSGDVVTITLNNYESANSWSNLVPWAAAVVPEPMTMGLLAAGGIFVLLNRRRK